MKVTLKILTIAVLLTSAGCKSQNEGSQGSDFTKNISDDENLVKDDSALLTFFENERNPIAPAFKPLPTGSNKPLGWIQNVMSNDIENGMVGALDELYPGIKADDLYNTARRGGLEDVPEMGDLELTGAAWETSIMWWNAETTGNWWDGFVRHAYFTNDEASIRQSESIVQNLLDSQDEDGYIGIYKPNLRYQHEGSNGELWAQTTAFRMLLAYYEFTGDKNVLDAVEKAMAVTMKNYGQDGKNPFDLKNAFGGVTHGLMMTDVCESLYRITGETKYQDYATYLYRAFSSFDINRAFNDIRYPFLVKKEEPFTGHGVHTYEHLRSLLNAYHATGYEELRVAYENALVKLEDCILPSGAGHAMEWIGGMMADPTHTATEYCTMLELRNFLGTAAQKTGNVSFADMAEKLTFNAMFGARNEEGTAIAYGIPDNCYKLDGMSLDGEEKEVRYKYSPTHSEPAVCCAPNYSRNLPYYLDQMWGQNEEGIAALLYGPSKLSTKIDDSDISIIQSTRYPYHNEITLEITTSHPQEFTLFLRKPSWVKAMRITGGNGQLRNGFYEIRKEWKPGDKIHIAFDFDIEKKKAKTGEIYLQRGPLVYALPIAHSIKSIKDYDLKGFHDYHFYPKDSAYRHLAMGALDDSFEYRSNISSYLEGSMIDTLTNEEKAVQLVPMGDTYLRRVSFTFSP